MPRKVREKSASGIYHIIIRGINRQTIFEDEEDYARFLQTLQRYKEKSRYQVSIRQIERLTGINRGIVLKA